MNMEKLMVKTTPTYSDLIPLCKTCQNKLYMKMRPIFNKDEVEAANSHQFKN